MTLGLVSTSVGGGFTGSKAENSLALGHKAGAYYRPKRNVQFNVGNVGAMVIKALMVALALK